MGGPFQKKNMKIFPKPDMTIHTPIESWTFMTETHDPYRSLRKILKI
jgi:hypothetical protein